MIDYKNNILAIASTIMHHYGKECIHPQLDLDLSKYKKIVLVLMDGMGMVNIRKEDYVTSKVAYELSTVFPPTTVAATTALRTGKAPVENGWVGWKQYFPKYDHTYVMFLNYDYYTREKSEQTIEEIMEYHPFYESLPVPSYEIYPAFKTKGMKNFAKQIEYCNQLLKENQECFIYIYQDEYDAIMHRYGIHSTKAMDYLDYINQTIQQLELDEDTIVLLTADHGHIDVENYCLSDYPDLMGCLRLLPTLEDRAVSFYIKEDRKEYFQTKFNEYFKDEFILLTHQEVFDLHLLGYGKENDRIHDFIGDFLALSTGDKCISMHQVYPNKGQHAGYTKEELMIPLVIITKENQ